MILGPDMQDYYRHSVIHLQVHTLHCIQNLQQWKSLLLRGLEFYWLHNCKSVSRYVFHMLTLCKRYCREIRNSKCEALYIMSKLSSISWSLSWSLSSSVSKVYKVCQSDMSIWYELGKSSVQCYFPPNIHKLAENVKAFHRVIMPALSPEFLCLHLLTNKDKSV